MSHTRKKFYSHCLLFFALVFSFSLLTPHGGSAATVGSVIAGHETCDNCHSRYPGSGGKGKNAPPAKIPAGKVDTLCLGCHGPGGVSSLKADVHGSQNYVSAPIGCMDCHNPHDNVGKNPIGPSCHNIFH